MRIKLDDGWEVEEAVKDSDGKLISRYWYGGKQAIQHELSSPIARQYAGYRLLRKDLSRIMEWLAHVETLLGKLPEMHFTEGENRRKGDENINQMISALLVAIVATYGKLFAEAEGRRIKLESEIITDKVLSALHQQIITWRKNYVAHSGSERIERSQLILFIASKDKCSVTHRLSCETSQPSSLIRDDYVRMRQLCEHLAEHCDKKLSKLLKKVKAHHLSAKEVHAVVELYIKAGKKF